MDGFSRQFPSPSSKKATWSLKTAQAKTDLFESFSNDEIPEDVKSVINRITNMFAASDVTGHQESSSEEEDVGPEEADEEGGPGGGGRDEGGGAAGEDGQGALF